MEEAVVFRAVPEITRQLHQAIEGQRSDVTLSLSCVGENSAHGQPRFCAPGAHSRRRRNRRIQSDIHVYWNEDALQGFSGYEACLSSTCPGQIFKIRSEPSVHY